MRSLTKSQLWLPELNNTFNMLNKSIDSSKCVRSTMISIPTMNPHEMLPYGNFPKSQCWPQICIFISFYGSLKARTQVVFVWILPIKLHGKKKNSTVSGQ